MEVELSSHEWLWPQMLFHEESSVTGRCVLSPAHPRFPVVSRVASVAPPQCHLSLKSSRKEVTCFPGNSNQSTFSVQLIPCGLLRSLPSPWRSRVHPKCKNRFANPLWEEKNCSHCFNIRILHTAPTTLGNVFSFRSVWIKTLNINGTCSKNKRKQALIIMSYFICIFWFLLYYWLKGRLRHVFFEGDDSSWDENITEGSPGCWADRNPSSSAGSGWGAAAPRGE